jgi:hypothetical protein
MGFWSSYLAYAHDNPEGYWFRRKIWGWGWTPVTWQGWAVTIGAIALIVAAALTLDEGATPQDMAFTFFLPILLVVSALIGIAYKTGEPPKWQWGFPKKDEHSL